jgi:hypothetical protein
MPPTTATATSPIFKSPLQRAEQAEEAVAHAPGGDVEDAVRLLMQALASMQSKSLDADAVRAIVQPMIDNINQPKVLQFQVPNRARTRSTSTTRTSSCRRL